LLSAEHFVQPFQVRAMSRGVDEWADHTWSLTAEFCGLRAY
jgi:hypothetical protein